MCADRDTTSSPPGLRGLLGRLLHGLLPYRLLQLLGAALSYLIGPWGEAVLAFLTPEWIVPRQVEAEDLPVMLEEVLLNGLKPRPWGVFTFMSTVIEGKGQESLSQRSPPGEAGVEIQYLQENGLWFLQQNQSWQDSKSDWEQDDIPHKLQAPMDPLAFFEWSQILQKPGLKLDLYGIPAEERPEPCQLVVPEPTDIETPVGHQKHPEVPPKLSISLNTGLAPACSEAPSDPSPDQGYNSLEDWQVFQFVSETNTANREVPKDFEPDGHHRVCNVPKDQLDLNTEVMKAEPSIREDDGLYTDLEEEIPVPDAPVCTNKYIGYILGTLVSDDEDLSSFSDEDSSAADDDEEEDDDDGFDSEGSVLETDSGAQATEGAKLWNSFYTPDPYNPQNFTAVQHTGALAEETSHVHQVHEDVLSDEESWCESDALSSSDSEDECSIDEEENLKLWNSFSKSDDPYNPLCFKASVHTFEGKRRQHRDATCKNTHLICDNLQYCKLSTPCPNECPQLPRYHNKPLSAVERSCAIIVKRKVTFHDEVTVYNISNEEDRKGPWEEFARDRCRFQRRIQDSESSTTTWSASLCNFFYGNTSFWEPRSRHGQHRKPPLPASDSAREHHPGNGTNSILQNIVTCPIL